MVKDTPTIDELKAYPDDVAVEEAGPDVLRLRIAIAGMCWFIRGHGQLGYSRGLIQRRPSVVSRHRRAAPHLGCDHQPCAPTRAVAGQQRCARPRDAFIRTRARVSASWWRRVQPPSVGSRGHPHSGHSPRRCTSIDTAFFFCCSGIARRLLH